MCSNGHEYHSAWRPGFVRLLREAGLDAVYERAEGDFLWQRRGDDLVPVLDLVGGYGAGLLGHNHPALVAEMRRLLDARVPILAQGSNRRGAVELADALRDRLGDYAVIFTNTGTETVEAAIKHAVLERGRYVIWAVKGAFHGKTCGSIQLTWNYRNPYTRLGPDVVYLDPSDTASWKEAERSVDDVAAAFVEPILGEGGVRPLPAAFAEWLVVTCRESGIPLVADEIQTGLGRTGTFLASEALGIDPDYVCLSKSLGGGLAKIGALLVRRSRFIDEFAISHTSTFADDELSCRIGLKVLEILESEHVSRRCGASGRLLLEALNELAQEYPDVLADVRGKGLMVGVELRSLEGCPSYALRLISEQGYLGYMAAAYFLHVHDIRVAPTLSQFRTLRIQPSAFVREADLRRFVRALATFCSAVRSLDVVHLVGHHVNVHRNDVLDFAQARPVFRKDPPLTDRRVAFLAHLVLPGHIALWDSSLAELASENINDFLSISLRPFEPAIFDQLHVVSATGERVHLNWINLYYTSELIAHTWKSGNGRDVLGEIDRAVALARDNGCTVAGLGGYTSVLTANGLRVRTEGIGLTSGNALTAGMGLLALRRAAEDRGMAIEEEVLGVVGATGNIASVYAMMMAKSVREMILVVRNKNSAKVEALVAVLARTAPGLRLRVSDDLRDLRHCRLIVAASNDPKTLIGHEQLSSDPVVICDIALPPDVDAGVRTARPDVTVINGGVVRLPAANADFRIGGLALEKGHVYACVAETLLMGLEGRTTHGSRGAITPRQVEWALQAAEKHGFVLGHLKTEPLDTQHAD